MFVLSCYKVRPRAYEIDPYLQGNSLVLLDNLVRKRELRNWKRKLEAKMTTLTDLPNEVLNAIFRQFLSKKLTEHGYICEWIPEKDARRTRATLYSLALVSKRLSTIALPLLYEQLFDSRDMERYMLSNPKPAVASSHMGFVRYLSIDAGGSQMPKMSAKHLAKKLPTYLCHCVGVLHLRVYLRFKPHYASMLLLKLSELAGMENLQSLSIRLLQCDGKHALFQDVCQFRKLVGLFISFEGEEVFSVGWPERPLECLKHLEVDYLSDLEESSACMAIASPDSLEILEFWEFHMFSPSAISLADIFGTHVWKRLRYIRLNTHSDLAPNDFVSFAPHLPALRDLRLDPKCGSSGTLAQILPSLPPRLRSLMVGHINMDQLLDFLHLIADASWLRTGIQEITLEINEVYDDSGQQEAYSKEHVLRLAGEAVIAARSHGVTLEPVDLVQALSELGIWTRQRLLGLGEGF